MGNIPGVSFPGYYPVPYPGSCFAYHAQFNVGLSSVPFPIPAVPSHPIGNPPGSVPHPTHYPFYQPMKPRSHAPPTHEKSDRSANQYLARDLNKLSFSHNENSTRSLNQTFRRNPVLKANVDSRYNLGPRLILRLQQRKLISLTSKFIARFQ